MIAGRKDAIQHVARVRATVGLPLAFGGHVLGHLRIAGVVALADVLQVGVGQLFANDFIRFTLFTNVAKPATFAGGVSEGRKPKQRAVG